jgi:hypothetical protein
MVTAPVVSVVVPCFNVIGKCERLLASLANAPAMVAEVIFVDDGSTDTTSDLLRAFCDTQDDRYQLMRIGNAGPGGARNIGLANAHGDYLWFVDADDEIDFAALRASYHDIAHYLPDIVDFDLRRGGAQHNTVRLEPGVHSLEEDARLRAKLIARFGEICCKLIKRDILIDNDLLYPERIFYEDNPIIVSLACLAATILKVPVVAYHHHQEHPSIMRGPITPRYLDRLITATMIIDFIGSQQLDEVVELAAVQEFDRLFYGTTVGSLMGRDPLLLCRILPKMISWRRKLLGRARTPAFMIDMPPSRSGRLLKTVAGFALWCMAAPVSYLYKRPERYFLAQHARAWEAPWSR